MLAFSTSLQRREFLRIGSLAVAGATLPNWLAARADGVRATADACILLWMHGGQPQHDLWDMKPDAPDDIRGDFKPIATNVNGVRIGELLPLTAQVMNKVTLIRSVTHNIGEHLTAGHVGLTGFVMQGRIENPTYGAVVAKLRGTPKAVLAVRRGTGTRNSSIRKTVTPGQYGGFLGKVYDPFRIADPALDLDKMTELSLPADLDAARLARRHDLLSEFDKIQQQVETSPEAARLDEHYRKAFAFLSRGEVKKAFDLSQEAAPLRERYGKNRFGQSCLLARRLVQAGVPFVQVNWTAQPDGDGWDTHERNVERLKTKLVPPFDAAFASLLGDLSERGLLERTLVVCMGEFGRTPKINKKAGRDHWAPCYSVLLAGGGVKAGFVLGASDAKGANPSERPVRPSRTRRDHLSLCLGLDGSRLPAPNG